MSGLWVLALQIVSSTFFFFFFTQKTILFIYFETESHVSQAGFRLTVQLRMTLSF